MDITLELGLLLGLIGPLLLVLLFLLTYANILLLRRIRLEQRRLRETNNTITRGHKRLYIIKPERD
jgi:hypothetical protein